MPLCKPPTEILSSFLTPLPFVHLLLVYLCIWLHVVQDGVLSKGGGLEEVEHGAGSKDGVEAVPFPGKEAKTQR